SAKVPPRSPSIVRRARLFKAGGGSSSSAFQSRIRPFSSMSIAILMLPTFPAATFPQSGSATHARGIDCVNAPPRSRTPGRPTAPSVPPLRVSEAPAPEADAVDELAGGADAAADATSGASDAGALEARGRADELTAVALAFGGE